MSTVSVGRAGEDAAAVYLASMGYEIIDRNFYSGKTETDIICTKGGYIIFIEIKTRRSDIFGGGALSVSEKKRAKLIENARRFMYSHRKYERYQPRFDVVEVYGENGKFSFNHYENAFICKGEYR